MTDYLTAKQERRVRIETLNGSVEGTFRISAMLRTLDDLNVVSKGFVTVFEPKVVSSVWSFAGEQMGVNKSSILFVQELSDPPKVSNKPFAGGFTRAAIRLRAGVFDVEGFVHVPPGGSAMRRLDQSNHPFISLTWAAVKGPDTKLTAPFLAVNRAHILAAQEIVQQDTADEMEMSFEAAD